MSLAIADGHVVTIHYRLTLDDGTIAEQTYGQEPAIYRHGSGNVVPGLERGLTGTPRISGEKTAEDLRRVCEAGMYGAI